MPSPEHHSSREAHDEQQRLRVFMQDIEQHKWILSEQLLTSHLGARATTEEGCAEVLTVIAQLHAQQGGFAGNLEHQYEHFVRALMEQRYVAHADTVRRCMQDDACIRSVVDTVRNELAHIPIPYDTSDLQRELTDRLWAAAYEHGTEAA
jgi:hypothetical protein